MNYIREMTKELEQFIKINLTVACRSIIGIAFRLRQRLVAMFVKIHSYRYYIFHNYNKNSNLTFAQVEHFLLFYAYRFGRFFTDLSICRDSNSTYVSYDAREDYLRVTSWRHLCLPSYRRWWLPHRPHIVRMFSRRSATAGRSIQLISSPNWWYFGDIFSE